MADESTGGNGADGAPEASGGEAAVNALFGDTAPADPGDGGDGADAKGEDAGGVDGEDTGSAGDGDSAWTAGYVPKAFRGQDGSFNGDQDAVFKSWMDGRQQVSRLQAQVAELKRDVTGEGQVEDEKQYVDDFDYAGLAEKAQNMVAEGGSEENRIIAGFLRHARAAGIPKARAHALATAYFEEISAEAPEFKAPEQLRKEAMEFLGTNSKQIAKDVQGFLASRARHSPFTKEQMAVVRSLTHSGPGMSLLYSLSRGAASTAPPSAASATKADLEREKEKALADLGLPEHEFAPRKEEILARIRRLNLDEEDPRTDLARG